MYVSSFSEYDPMLAIHHYRLIHEEKVRHDCICSLLVQVGNIEDILGTKDRFGGQLRDVFTDREIEEIIHKTALLLETNGRHLDAIKFYDLIQVKKIIEMIFFNSNFWEIRITKKCWSC